MMIWGGCVFLHTMLWNSSQPPSNKYWTVHKEYTYNMIKTDTQLAVSYMKLHFEIHDQSKWMSMISTIAISKYMDDRERVVAIKLPFMARCLLYPCHGSGCKTIELCITGQNAGTVQQANIRFLVLQAQSSDICDCSYACTVYGPIHSRLYKKAAIANWLHYCDFLISIYPIQIWWNRICSYAKMLDLILLSWKSGHPRMKTSIL